MEMSYFEDRLLFSEVTKKNVLGTIYFIIALFGVSINLATLTVLPECERTLTKPLFILFCTQLFTNIAGLVCVGVTVPYMIASDKAYFLNPILMRAPGTFLTLTLLFSFLIQFWICIYRNSSIVFPRTTFYLFSDVIVYAIHFLTIIFTLNRVVNITNDTEIRTFSIARLIWIQTESEYLNLLSLVAYAAMICLMFYGLSFFDLLYKHIYLNYDEQDLPSTQPLRQLLNQLLHLICDIIFGFLFILPPVEYYSNISITHSLITIYGTLVWPTISLIVYSPHIRRELCFRIIVMTKNGQMSSADQLPPPRRTENRFRFI